MAIFISLRSPTVQKLCEQFYLLCLLQSQQSNIASDWFGDLKEHIFVKSFIFFGLEGGLMTTP